MLATQSQPSLSRTTSIWRRLSRRESRSRTPTAENTPAPQRLQKRNKEVATIIEKKHAASSTQKPSAAAELVPAKKLPTTRASRSRAVASQMQTSSFPDSPSDIHTVPWNVFLTPDQVYNLFMGFKPEQMEDKWFIYSQGPDRSGKLKVHFHRSWTGMKVAELFVVIDLKGEGAGKIVGIKWNATEQTNGLDGEEAKYMIATTCAWVLGVNMENALI
ncbi:hypothetical protein BU24DRAFT_163538 [Aaosphaeria arxii CBS 175.79]|uniref:Uncharacterized protein n=1 Tax=Aaosphaeria arxii CBS 175.79 TaxID=1450172 RepID=A0A6A5XYW8_9PLEO|nr:uncharacterized protein BU24DRAFT_163538 [Aaosphaeria arxii CBS 175.79]KAF2018017.1 hypothetical protein BU24DRAFT_163538 [Aaosphaeria arxii CBS 175.79]